MKLDCIFEKNTLARPYAKALFEFSIENISVEHWKNILKFLVNMVQNEKMYEILSSQVITKDSRSKIFSTVCGNMLDKNGNNFIHVIADNERFLMIPEVFQKFLEIRIAFEYTIDVEVFSTHILREKQKKKINHYIEKRISHHVILNCKMDKYVIAGVIIRSKNIEINGSVRDILQRIAYIFPYEKDTE